jgi:hypothetical protein
MSEPDKSVDLAPHEWRSSDAREKPHEPLFGPGLPWAIGVIAAIVLVAVAKEYEWGLFGQISAGVIGAAIGAAASAVAHR